MGQHSSYLRSCLQKIPFQKERERPLLIRLSLATTTAWLFGWSLTRGSTSIATLFQHQKRDKNTDSPFPHSANWENGFGKILSSSVQYRLHRGDGWSYNSNSLNEGQRQCHRILEYCITVLKKVTNREIVQRSRWNESKTFMAPILPSFMVLQKKTKIGLLNLSYR